MAKLTKRELFDQEVEKIYTNTSLSLPKALCEYEKFFDNQKFIKKATFDLEKFVVRKTLYDYLAEDIKPKSFIEYEALFNYKIAVRDVQLFEYKPFAFRSLYNFIKVSERRILYKRFKELNPDMCTLNELLMAFISISKDNVLCPLVLQQLNELQDKIPIKGADLLIRLPIIQENIYRNWSLLIKCDYLPKIDNFEFNFIACGNLEEREKVKKIFAKEGIEIL